jgi:methionyl-tRNA formyltransferase
LEAIAPDAIVVVAYGRIIPPWMLSLPRLGCINLHGSLLPKYRGAAPIQWAVAMGETITGNTTMLLEEGLDTGPILLQRQIAINPEQNAADLFDVLAKAGAPLVVETLTGLADGTIQPHAQNNALATLAPMLEREDGRIDFAAHNATAVRNRWRGFQPWPGAFTVLDGKKLIVHRMKVADAPGTGVAGEVRIKDQRMLVACAGSSWIEFAELQLEGKKRLGAAEFLRGAGLRAGTRLG